MRLKCKYCGKIFEKTHLKYICIKQHEKIKDIFFISYWEEEERQEGLRQASRTRKQKKLKKWFD